MLDGRTAVVWFTKERGRSSLPSTPRGGRSDGAHPGSVVQKTYVVVYAQRRAVAELTVAALDEAVGAIEASRDYFLSSSFELGSNATLRWIVEFLVDSSDCTCGGNRKPREECGLCLAAKDASMAFVEVDGDGKTLDGNAPAWFTGIADVMDAARVMERRFFSHTEQVCR